MKENIIIVGYGEHANVVLYNVLCQDKYNVVGFISSDDKDSYKRIKDRPILGRDEDIEKIIKEYNIRGYILGVGNMKIRRRLIQFYSSFKRIKPVTIIHPNAVIADDAQIGDGTLVECGCLLTPNPIIGKHCVINTMSGINHENILGENVFIASGVTLSGGVHINDDTLIDDGVTVSLGSKVGKNCIIGAGSVVTTNIPDFSIAYGVPAKVVKDNKKEIIMKNSKK